MQTGEEIEDGELHSEGEDDTPSRQETQRNNNNNNNQKSRRHGGKLMLSNDEKCELERLLDDTATQNPYDEEDVSCRLLRE